MNNYVPKVGDKVRATLGENVLVGEVEYADNKAVELRCNGSLFPLYEDSWNFEPLVSVPTKFGAVIRRADGKPFTLIDRDDPDRLRWWSAGAGWAKESDATAGGFTVLFEGVDE